MSIKTIRFSSDKFPERLTRLYVAPKQINTIGADLGQLLESPTLGIVGSRKVSLYGRSVTADLSASAARKGAVIISGLALGVDSIAHKSVIDVAGKTIAVLPSGIEKIYPASHTGLARSILQKGGALVSEYSGKDLPMKHQFIERNRIIAALSDALLITEAAENSGSLHTARFALELGKPVLAVPGNINSPTSRGTNNLIKMGATPITSPEDLLELLDIKQSPAEKTELYGDNEAETTILQLISEGALAGGQLLELSQLTVSDFQQHLTMLEIKGRVKAHGNDTWGLA